MSSKAMIREGFRAMVPPQVVQVRQGTVKAVDAAARTCDVDVAGAIYHDVSLFALPGGQTGVLVVPVVGSTVLVGSIEGVDVRRYVAQYTEAEEVHVTLAGGQEVRITGEGITLAAGAKIELAPAGVNISNAGQTLRSILDTLADIVGALAPIAAAPGSPTAPNPADTAKITLLKTRISQLLNA